MQEVVVCEEGGSRYVSFSASSFMSLFRKLRTLHAIVVGCRNWPTVITAKLGFGSGGRLVQLRNGLELEVKNSVAISWGQLFEPAVADIYRIVEADVDLIVDVGSNIGSFSCLAAWTHPNARVIAFEPQKDQVALLRRNLERNSLNNVEINETAVTADGRDVILYCQSNDGAANIFESGDGNEVRLESTTLESVPFSKARSAFIKLDCEGAEGELIEWLVMHLQSLPEKMQIACEYHPWCPIPAEQSIKLLRQADFVVTFETHFDEPYIYAFRGR